MKKIDFFRAFDKNGVLLKKDEFCSVYSLNYGGAECVIKVAARKASKHSVIHCNEADIILEKLYRFGLRPSIVKTVMTRKNFAEKGKRGIFVIKGSPMLVKGLDENGFISHNGKIVRDDDVYVMLYSDFESFESAL